MGVYYETSIASDLPNPTMVMKYKLSLRLSLTLKRSLYFESEAERDKWH